jgi:YidC/Oxa1 family membrane protein insertase
MSERNPYSPEPEGNNQIRTLLAFILMGLVLFGSSYFFKSDKPPQPDKTAKIAAPKTAGSSVAPPPTGAGPNAVTPNAVTPNAAAPAAVPVVAAHAEQTAYIDTAVYHVVFSNRGGVVTSWTLKKYPSASGKPLELVNAPAAPKTGYPLAFDFRAQKPPVDLNQSLFVASKSPDGTAVTFEFAAGGVTARKHFQFQPTGYLTDISTEVSVNGTPIPHLLAWHGGFGDFAVQNATGIQHAIRYNVSDSKLQNDGTKAAKEHPVDRDGQFSFVGLEDQYFAAVFLPETSGTVQTTVYTDYVPTEYDKGEQPYIGAAVGGEGQNRIELFVGPKDLGLLKQVNPKLEQIVDFGMFWFLAKPLFLVLRFLDQAYVHNYGWSIVIATVIINFLLFPLRLINMKSMKRMQKLQPQIQAINEKYKGLSLRDPKMQMKNQETMELYKQHGANPMAGCLPMLIQMPFLFAFYKVLAVSIEMRGANWLWVHDLSQPEHLAIKALPVIMIITSFLMQRMTPTTGMDPSQQKMMMFMPLMMGFFFYNQSSGLVLYWLTGNLMGIAQQYFFNKTIAPAATPPASVVVKSSGSRAPAKKQLRK